MKPLLYSLSLLSLCSYAGAIDILNFTNNDTLHGEFIGYTESGKLIWKSNNADNNIHFDKKELRRVIMRQGASPKPFSHSSYLTLANGDIIPCEVLDFTKDKVNIRTDFAGQIELERKNVKSISINPLGKEVLYNGPVNEANWEVIEIDSTGLQKDGAETLDPDQPAWEYGSFSWYNNGKMGAIANKKNPIPDAFRMSFKAEARRYSNVALMFHADFKAPSSIPNDGQKRAAKNISAEKVTKHFGSCFALRINPSSSSLAIYHVTEDGTSSYTHLPTTNGRTRIYGSNTDLASNIELRVNRSKKIISAFRDDKVIGQWDLQHANNIPTGSGFGFMSLHSGESYLTRISHIVIAPWNGIVDSQASLSNEDRDVVMLSNGTDRFSGAAEFANDDHLSFKGKYAELHIPRNELESVHFASSATATKESFDGHWINFEFYGTGKLSAKSLGTSDEGVLISHPILGNLTLKKEFLSSIDYDQEPSLLDLWNTKLKKHNEGK